MYAVEPRVKSLSAVASAAIVLGFTLALIFGLGVARIAQQAQSLGAVVFSPDPPVPPRKRERPRPKSRPAAAKGDPAPRALSRQATQIVIPPVPFVIKPPPPVVTAPVANVGSAASNGASDLSGPGQGAGGLGNGFGGGGEGGFGDGSGGGRREPPVEPPKHVRGKLAYNDAPGGMVPEGGEAAVGVLYAVDPDGRVGHCEIERSSGIAGLDALVCRLIEERFVFRPARDRFGHPARAWIAETHSFFGRPEGG